MDIVGGGHAAGTAFLMGGDVPGPGWSSHHLSASKGGSFGLSWTERSCHLEAQEELTSRYRPAWQPEWLAALPVTYKPSCGLLMTAHFTKHRNRLFQRE